MNVLSITYAELERLLKVFGWVTAALAASLAFARWRFFDASLVAAGFQGVTAAITVTTILLGFLARSTWCSPRLARWLSRPIVHGVWIGELRTDFKRPDGSNREPIRIAFVIRQTYLSLSIQSFTASQEGESKLEALVQNAKNESTRLCYTFELLRQYGGENKLTAGSGDLKLLEQGQRLKGHYWTNSPTQGELDLRLVCRDCDGIDSFEAASRKADQ